MPRFALASSPGSKAFTPGRGLFDVDGAANPVFGGSKGRSTIGTFCGQRKFCLLLQQLPDVVTHQVGIVRVAVEGSSATTVICGNKSANARIVVDLPVPRSPIIITPPIFNTFNSKANFISSWPTMAVKGKQRDGQLGSWAHRIT